MEFNFSEIIEKVTTFLFGPFSYTNKKGIRFYLHKKKGRQGITIYYFSKNEEGAIQLPENYEVVEGSRGLPVLKKTGEE